MTLELALHEGNNQALFQHYVIIIVKYRIAEIFRGLNLRYQALKAYVHGLIFVVQYAMSTSS